MNPRLVVTLLSVIWTLTHYWLVFAGATMGVVLSTVFTACGGWCCCWCMCWSVTWVVSSAASDCCINSLMFVSSSSIRCPMSSIRLIICSVIDWNLSCISWSNPCTYRKHILVLQTLLVSINALTCSSGLSKEEAFSLVVTFALCDALSNLLSIFSG